MKIGDDLGKGMKVGEVPCDGCTRCCVGDSIRMLPGDDMSQYRVERHNRMAGAWMLAHKPNGDCIYLHESGCTIHNRRPQMCREMDCRLLAKRLTFTQVRKLQGFPMPVWKRGRELLKLAEVNE